MDSIVVQRLTVFNIPMKENTHKKAFQQANVMVRSKGFSTICITLDPMVIKSKYDITIPIAKGQVLAAKSVKYSLLKLFSNGVEIRVGKYFNALERLFDSVDISKVIICIAISVLFLTNHST